NRPRRSAASTPSPAPRMRAASRPAFFAPPMDTVATGTPDGIWTIDSRESIPSRCFRGTGTPMTGRDVIEAIIPGRWAAPPAPAMMTRAPRSAADFAQAIMSSGMRWAETTSALESTPSSSRASAAAFIVGRSESDPRTMPTGAAGVWCAALICASFVSVDAGPCDAGSFGVGVSPGQEVAGGGQLGVRIDVDSGDEVRGVAGPGQHEPRVLAIGVDVSELAARAHALAVEVDLDRRVVGHDMQIGLVEVLVLGAEDVDHHGDVLPGRRAAQGQVEDGAQVLLELTRHRPVLCPVPGVVGAHGEFVDEEAVGGLEHLHGHDTGDVEGAGDLEDRLRDLLGLRRLESGGRSDRLFADSVLLPGLDHRPYGRLPHRGASDHDRELTGEIDLLLGEQLWDLAEPVDGLVEAVDDADALAVVTAARSLEDEGIADSGGEGLDVGGRGDLRPGGIRQAEFVHLRPHPDLVLSEDEGLRARTHDVAGLDQGLEMLRRDVFVIEGDDVDGLGEGLECRIVRVVADTHFIDDLSGGGIAGLCEDGEPDAEGFCGGREHACQLAAANDTDTRKSHVCHPNADLGAADAGFADRSVASGFRRRAVESPARDPWSTRGDRSAPAPRRIRPRNRRRRTHRRR